VPPVGLACPLQDQQHSSHAHGLSVHPRGLDYVLNMAPSYGIRVLLVLTDYWNDLGGMQTYVTWANWTDGNYTGIRDFYTSEHVKAS
jgi:endo-1,4-beta-mannosidase